jgi:hypothetical protein
LRGALALLGRGSLSESYIKRLVEPVALSTIGLKAVVIRAGDVWHDTDPGWRLGVNWKLLANHLPDALAVIGGMTAAERRLL